MSRPRILIDVDGPLTFGFARTACQILRDLGVDAETYGITQWDIARAFGVSKEVEAEMYAVLRRKGVASSFDPRAGAAEFLTGLREWADVVAVTSPLPGSPTWASEREEWLRSMLGFKAKEVVSVADKKLIAGDALVEDRAENLVDWHAAHPEKLPILWDATYNQAESAAIRVRDFEELRRVLETNLKVGGVR